MTLDQLPIALEMVAESMAWLCVAFILFGILLGAVCLILVGVCRAITYAFALICSDIRKMRGTQ